jgi:hypothetical protein
MAILSRLTADRPSFCPQLPYRCTYLHTFLYDFYHVFRYHIWLHIR